MRKTSFAVCCAILSSTAVTLADTADGRGLSGKAYLWPYESLCSLPEPPAPPKSFRTEKDTSITQRGCIDLEKEWGKPAAVRVHFVNAATAEGEVVIKGLSAISVKGKAGRAARALGFQLRQPAPLGGGSTKGIVTALEGTFAFAVPGEGGAVDLILLFKTAFVGDSVTIGGTAPMRIEK
jgi:hypothetical protein